MPLIKGTSIATTTPETIRKYFNRLNKEELITLWKAWKIDQENGGSVLYAKKTKKSLVARVVDTFFINGITYEQVAQIELTYHQTRPSRHIWTVFQLTPPEEGSVDKVVAEASLMQTLLCEELNPYFRHHTYVQDYQNNFWVRLGFYDDIILNQSLSSSKFSIQNHVYLVYFPHTLTVFATGIRPNQAEFIQHAVMRALRCVAIQVSPLKSRQLESLADLHLNATSQGPFRKMRLESSTDNPLDHKRRRKDNKKNTADEEVIMEDIVEQGNKKTIIENIFGDGESSQAALETLTIHIKAPCKVHLNNSHDTDDDEPLVMKGKVKFEGANVIEGLRELVAKGHASNLPSFITDNMFKRNVIHVDEHDITT